VNKDHVTTVLGAVGAIAMAVNPVLGGVTTGTLHGGDWMQIASAGLFALLGYFTNKR